MSSSRTVAASDRSSLWAIDGTSSTIAGELAHADHEDASGRWSAITDAVRGPWSSRASSPTHVPGADGGHLLARCGAPRRCRSTITKASRPSDALLAEGLARREVDLVGRPGDRLQLLLRARREERDRCEVVEVRLAGHGRRSIGNAVDRRAAGVAPSGHRERFTGAKQPRNLPSLRSPPWMSSSFAGPWSRPGATSCSARGGLACCSSRTAWRRHRPAPDDLEDWIRVPAGEVDLRARVEGLRRRAEARVDPAPALDDDGVLRLGDRWVSLPPVEARLTAALLDRYGAVVSRDALAAGGVAGGRARPQRARRAHAPAPAPARRRWRWRSAPCGRAATCSSGWWRANGQAQAQ